MAKFDTVRARMREICLALPDTKETLTWGKPHFRVGEKIFAGCGEENGRLALGFKLEPAHAKAIVKDPRFSPAPYVGHKGWVSMDADGVKDWKEVQALVLESYRLIAPKKSLAKIATGEVPAAPARKPAAARMPAPARKRKSVGRKRQSIARKRKSVARKPRPRA